MALYDGKGNEISIGGTIGNIVLAQHIVENPNLANPNDFVAGILNSDGTINTANTAGATTDYIPCSPGQIVTVGGITGYNHNPWFVATGYNLNCYGYYFYDNNKTALSGATSRPTVSDGITVPDGASYARVSFYGDSAAGGVYYDQNPEDAFVHVGDTLCAEPKRWFEDNIEKTWIPAENIGYTYQPPYAGKRWVLFGDSLTDNYAGHGWDSSTQNTGGVGWTKDDTYVEWTGYLWASRIARELGLTLDNRAKSGSNIYYGEGYTYADVNGCIMLDAYIAEVEAGTTECADYITVGFGGNTRTQDIGTNEDTSETRTSVYGAMKYFIEKLRYLQKNFNQNMVFGFVLPPQSSWGEGDVRITSGRAAMLEVLQSDDYAVPYCDMWTESGICLDQMTDGIHVASIESNNLYYHAMRRFMMGL